jgi:hypothetical protein
VKRWSERPTSIAVAGIQPARAAHTNTIPLERSAVCARETTFASRKSSTSIYDVSNSVVTLTGHVNSEAKRAEAQRIATRVPNVKQVVNEIQVKGQKATSMNR